MGFSVVHNAQDRTIRRQIDRSVWPLVRTHDHDRYLATLFAPSKGRDALMALYAFNIDVSHIPETVSEPMLGEMRLQWWRDAIETLESGGITGNPVADALGRAIQEYGLPRALITSIIDARTFDLSGEAMPDMTALKAYLQKTSGNIFALAARILTHRNTPEQNELAAQAGFAWGLVRLLAQLPAHLSNGRLYLPLSYFRDHGADTQSLFSGKADAKTLAVLVALRAEAQEAFAPVRKAVAVSPREGHGAFLILALVPSYLKALESHAETPLDQVALIGPMQRIFCLGSAAFRGKI